MYTLDLLSEQAGKLGDLFDELRASDNVEIVAGDEFLVRMDSTTDGVVRLEMSPLMTSIVSASMALFLQRHEIISAAQEKRPADLEHMVIKVTSAIDLYAIVTGVGSGMEKLAVLVGMLTAHYGHERLTAKLTGANGSSDDE